MLIRNPLRSPVMRAICSAFNVIDGLTPAPPPAGIYGALADAGEVNDADVVTGSRYYFDFVGGLDSNASATFAAPGKTLDYVYDWMTTDGTAGGKLAPRGSAILLKRGTTQDGFLVFNNFDSSAFGDYLVGSYGAGSRPLITFKQSSVLNTSNVRAISMKRAGGRVKNVKVAGQYVASFTGTASGTFTTGETVTGGTSGATGIYQFYAGAALHCVAVTSMPTTFAAGEVVTGGSSGVTVTVGTRSYPAGVVIEDANCRVESVELTNLTGDGIEIGSGGVPKGNNTVITNTTISNACRVQSNGAGIAEGNGDNIQITNNTVFDCGGAGSNTSHNIYLGDVTNTTISGNWSYMTGNNGNHALVMHGVCADVTIEDNLFEACGNGIGINGGHASAESYTRFIVRRNINRLHGTVHVSPAGQAIQVDSLVDSDFYNNLHYGTLGAYNIKEKGASGGADAAMTNTRFSHETIHNCKYGVIVGGTFGASPPVFQNNIISSSRTTNNELILWADAAAIASGFVFRNNIIWAPNATGNVILWGATYYTLAAWMAAFGTGLGFLNVDPLFVDAATGDFRLQAGSPAKLAGYNSGITTDFANNARHATTPSIGAYE